MHLLTCARPSFGCEVNMISQPKFDCEWAVVAEATAPVFFDGPTFGICPLTASCTRDIMRIKPSLEKVLPRRISLVPAPFHHHAGSIVDLLTLARQDGQGPQSHDI
jgi:hypothetical protein